jgi:predicted nuclease of predicted toxin-antitoxin system
VKLLFDQNLSPNLVKGLADIYPNSTHVFLIGLDRSSDEIIWDYARDNDYVIVTKDADFSDLSVLLGFPPKTVWIKRGNCTTTKEIETMLRSNYDTIKNLAEDENAGVLTLF